MKNKTIKFKPRDTTMKNLITLILLSTLASCTSLTPSVKEYSITKHYRIIGTKCSSNAYYSHELNKCVRAERVDALASQERIPSVSPVSDLQVTDSISNSRLHDSIQRKQSVTKRKATPVIRRSKKIDCAYVLNNINQCSI